MYSELISAAIATGGPHASKTTAVKLMRRWVEVEGDGDGWGLLWWVEVKGGWAGTALAGGPQCGTLRRLG